MYEAINELAVQFISVDWFRSLCAHV